MLPFVLVVSALQVAGDPPPAPAGDFTIRIPRIEAEVVIDGLLDEAVWQQAARLTDFFQYEPVDGRPAEERTDVLVWYTPDAIHFGVIARDSDPGSIRATNADRDNIDSDDHVLIYLDTFNDSRRAYFFGVNPLGVQQDGVRTEGAVNPGQLFGGATDTSPDFIYESSGRLGPEGYVVELRIPFKTLRFQGNGAQSWGLNVLRKIQRTGYSDTWTSVRRANASFLVQAGTMVGLEDLRTGAVWEVAPFATGSLSGARGGDGVFGRGDMDPDFGANVRVGLTNLTVDGTVNPDFSQVETDAGQVTTNERFSLFFPEKRPFFLEGIELFATPNQLIHTRQIVDPKGGVKLTGKFGSVGVAYLAAADANQNPGGDDALVNLVRVRKDVGESSLVGITYTDRSGLGSQEFNRVLAADLRYVFGRLYYVEAQVGSGWTRDAEGGTRSDAVWKTAVDRTGRAWGFNYELGGFGDDFETRSGFVPRTGIVSGHAFNRVSYYGEPGAVVENITAFAGPSRIWSYDDFGSERAFEGGETGTVTFTLRGGWRLSANGGRSFWTLDPSAYGNYAEGSTPFVPAVDVAGPAFGLSASTPVLRTVDASLSFNRGVAPLFAEGSEGRVSSVTAGLNLRPRGALRIGVTNTLSYFQRSRDSSEFGRIILPRLQVEFQPNRSLFFRAIGEYLAERRAALLSETGVPLTLEGETSTRVTSGDFRLDFLVSYEPSPGTVAFLGYGTSLDGTSNLTLRDLTRRTDGFFVKVAYQVRR